MSAHHRKKHALKPDARGEPDEAFYSLTHRVRGLCAAMMRGSSTFIDLTNTDSEDEEPAASSGIASRRGTAPETREVGNTAERSGCISLDLSNSDSEDDKLASGSSEPTHGRGTANETRIAVNSTEGREVRKRPLETEGDAQPVNKVLKTEPCSRNTNGPCATTQLAQIDVDRDSKGKAVDMSNTSNHKENLCKLGDCADDPIVFGSDEEDEDPSKIRVHGIKSVEVGSSSSMDSLEAEVFPKRGPAASTCPSSLVSHAGLSSIKSNAGAIGASIVHAAAGSRTGEMDVRKGGVGGLGGWSPQSGCSWRPTGIKVSDKAQESVSWPPKVQRLKLPETRPDVRDELKLRCKRETFQDLKESEGSRALATRVRSLVQEQLFCGSAPGRLWMSDLCSAILDSRNTSPTMARELLSLSALYLRFLHSQRVREQGEDVPMSGGAPGAAGCRMVCALDAEALVKVTIEATDMLARWGQMIDGDNTHRGEWGRDYADPPLVADAGVGASKRRKPRNQKACGGSGKLRPAVKCQSGSGCGESSRKDAHVYDPMMDDAESQMVRASMVLRIACDLAKHDGEMVSVGGEQGCGFGLQPGQHWLCQGLLTGCKSVSGGVQWVQHTSSKEFQRLAYHLLFVVECLHDVIRKADAAACQGKAGESQGEAACLMAGRRAAAAAMTAENLLDMLGELTGQLFTAHSVWRGDNFVLDIDVIGRKLRPAGKEKVRSMRSMRSDATDEIALIPDAGMLFLLKCLLPSSYMHARGGRSEERAEGVQWSGEGARARSQVGPWDLLMQVVWERLKDVFEGIPPLQRQAAMAQQLVQRQRERKKDRELVQARWLDLENVCRLEASSKCAEEDDELLQILNAHSSHVAGMGATGKRKCEQIKDQDTKPGAARGMGAEAEMDKLTREELLIIFAVRALVGLTEEARSESDGLFEDPRCEGPLPDGPLPDGVRAWLAEKQRRDRLWKSVRLIG